MENELMTLQEAAEYLRVTEKTVINYADKGWLTPLTVPEGRGPIRFRTEEVKNLFKVRAKAEAGRD